MVALPKRKHLERGESYQQKKVRDEMIKAFEASRELVQNFLESLMREERAIYLDTHPTSANGYYTRDLLTLVGPVDDRTGGPFPSPGPPHRA